MANNVLTVFVTIFIISSVLCSNYYDYVGKRLITSNELEDQKLVNISSACLSEWNVSKAVLKEVEMGIFPNKSRELMCYYSCYFQKYGTMSSNGTFNLELLKNKLSPALYKGGLFCMNKVETVDPCERAFELYSCFIEKMYVKTDITKRCL